MPDRSYAEGINTQRIALAANLTTMGVSSVGTESLTDLVAKVLTVSDDADALAAEIVSGKTAYVDGAKVTGTMPDKEGDNACSSSSVDGTTLKARLAKVEAIPSVKTELAKIISDPIIKDPILTR